MSRLRPWLGAIVLTGSLTAGCGEPSEAERASLDTRLETHAVLPGEPTPAGLAYVRAVAKAHRQADQASTQAEALEILAAALERAPPQRDGVAELVHLGVLARTAELSLEQGAPQRALALLAPRLEPEISLPIDRASARCLIALGDAAARRGDHVLAMGSYARALEMLSLLMDEVDP